MFISSYTQPFPNHPPILEQTNPYLSSFVAQLHNFKKLRSNNILIIAKQPHKSKNPNRNLQTRSSNENKYQNFKWRAKNSRKSRQSDDKQDFTRTDTIQTYLSQTLSCDKKRSNSITFEDRPSRKRSKSIILSSKQVSFDWAENTENNDFSCRLQSAPKQPELNPQVLDLSNQSRILKNHNKNIAKFERKQRFCSTSLQKKYYQSKTPTKVERPIQKNSTKERSKKGTKINFNSNSLKENYINFESENIVPWSVKTYYQQQELI